MPPSAGEEFQDPHRGSLVRRLQDDLGLNTINPTAWLFLWFSDLKTLRAILNRVQQKNVDTKACYWEYLNFSSTVMDDVLATWLENHNDSLTLATELSSSDPDFPVEDTEVEALCRERDSEECVLTKDGDTFEVFRICPAVLKEGQDTEMVRMFWHRLGQFWPKEKIATWKKAIEDLNNKKGLENLICLSSHVNQYWKRGRVAFKPISKTPASVTLRFFWIPLTHSDLLSPASNFVDSAPRGGKLWNCVTEQKICSGHEIILGTKNPNTLPLPSWDLLELQWILQRIVGLTKVSQIEYEF